ncbi:hypothetical protein QIH01_29045 [Brevibacillus brevis]|uniref:hypothetical protein n=1 Tax=Brevibacillus brevis TaxID=1393 RepID=UPI0007D8B8F0|nr:hypothetical protein [Brevibacillus brevis]WGV59470.1 hypothetical protein QIH01_29045 [Brevibacillus brevis]
MDEVSPFVKCRRPPLLDESGGGLVIAVAEEKRISSLRFNLRPQGGRLSAPEQIAGALQT